MATALTLDQVSDRSKALGGRKFTPADVDDVLLATAQAYAESYRGTFGFMLEMRAAQQRYHRLSPGQAKGVLNCMLAEVARQAKAPTQATTPAAPVTAVENGHYTIDFDQVAHVTLRLSRSNTRGVQNLAVKVGNDYAKIGKVTDGTTLALWQKGYIWDGDPIEVTERHREAVRVLFGADQQQRQAFGLAYAKGSGNCYKCNELLTEPESIDRGLGPICSGQGYTRKRKGSGSRTAAALAPSMPGTFGKVNCLACGLIFDRQSYDDVLCEPCARAEDAERQLDYQIERQLDRAPDFLPF